MCEPERLHALVIGAGDDLPVTARDAEAVANVLIKGSGVPERNVDLRIERAGDRSGVIAGLDALAARVTESSVALVYFSGHGMGAPRPCIVPHGFDPAHVPETVLEEADLTARLRAIRAGRLVVLLDCCFAGGAALPKSMSSTEWVPVAKTLTAAEGRVIVASSRDVEVSWTGRPLSAFTQGVVEGFSAKAASFGTGCVHVLDIAMWTSFRTRQLTEEKQNPVLLVANLSHNYDLCPIADLVVPEPTARKAPMGQASDDGSHPLHTIPMSPMIDPMYTTFELTQAYGARFASPTDRMLALNRANLIRATANPEASLVDPGRILYPDRVSPQEYWTAVFLEASRHGARMVAALLMLMESPYVVPESARRQYETLWTKLRAGTASTR